MPDANTRELSVRVGVHGETSAILYPAAPPALGAALVLAHGAGAGQRSGWMTAMASALATRGVDVMTFDFLYAHQRRRLPDRAPLLEACWRAAIETATAHIDTARRALFIGGKSMGGRIATHVAAADPGLPIAGLVLLGYPLHPPGRPDRRRDAHLPGMHRPMLIVQGSRDAFGTPAELEPVLKTVPAACALHVVDGGDHSFKVSKKDPAAQVAVQDEVASAIVTWIRDAVAR